MTSTATPIALHCDAHSSYHGEFAAGTLVVARSGTLRLRARDPSLDDLLGAAPARWLLLREGDCHRLAQAAMIELRGSQGGTTFFIQPAPPRTRLGPMVARLRAWTVAARAWSSRHGLELQRKS